MYTVYSDCTGLWHAKHGTFCDTFVTLLARATRSAEPWHVGAYPCDQSFWVAFVTHDVFAKHSLIFQPL